MTDPGPRATSIDIEGQTLELRSERAVWWVARRTLIVADTHFAKDDVFRRGGIAVPRGATVDDLQRLTRLIRQTSAERLVVLGDFLHARLLPADSFVHAFALWRAAHPQLTIEVIGGNHDRYEPRSRWAGRVSWIAAPYVEPPFAFIHEPRDVEGAFALCGHIHPALRLRERAAPAGCRCRCSGYGDAIWYCRRLDR